MANSVTWTKYLADGDAALANQKISQAEQCYRHAIKLIDNQPHDTADVVKCLGKLGNILALEAKTNDAAAIYLQMLSIVKKTYGQASPKTLNTLFALGSLYEAAGDHTFAMKFYQQALDINEKDFSQFDPAVNPKLDLQLKKLVQVRASTSIFKRKSKSNTKLSAIQEQPGLKASWQLLQKVNTDDHDLIAGEEDSDRSLLDDFQREMPKQSTKINTYDEMLSNNLQMEARKPSIKRLRKAGAS